jgi:DNA-directed RNA polymerase specialized sigma24 family protein
MAVPNRRSPAMHFPSHEQKQALLEQVLRIADQRLASAAAKEARAFITQYYDQVDPEDMATRDPEDLYGASLPPALASRCPV